MNRTNIEYLDYSWNPTTGCSPVSEGCSNCWARKQAQRFKGRFGYPEDEPFRPTFHQDRLDEPLNLKKPSIIGTAFMGDLFHEDISFEFIQRVVDSQNNAPQHTYLWLTKRPQIMEKFIKSHYAWNPGSNVWLGVSVENQRTADERIPILLQIPAAVRFLSVEPLLSSVDLKNYLHCGLSWCILGCESGIHTRPMKEEWARKVILQCKEKSIPVFYKQKMENGKLIKMPFLDGKQYAEFPETPSQKER